MGTCKSKKEEREKSNENNNNNKNIEQNNNNEDVENIEYKSKGNHSRKDSGQNVSLFIILNC